MHGPTGPSSVRLVATEPDAEIENQVARYVLIWVLPKEHLRLESVILAEPERNRADSRDLSPVAPDWRNGRACTVVQSGLPL